MRKKLNEQKKSKRNSAIENTRAHATKENFINMAIEEEIKAYKSQSLHLEAPENSKTDHLIPGMTSLEYSLSMGKTQARTGDEIECPEYFKEQTIWESIALEDEEHSRQGFLDFMEFSRITSGKNSKAKEEQKTDIIIESGKGFGEASNGKMNFTNICH